MEQQTDRNPAPAPVSRAPSTAQPGVQPVDQSAELQPAEPRALDAHGFDPDDYDWVPVPRQRNRANGWTVAAQRRFLEVLADTGSVTDACDAVQKTKQSAYALRRAAGAEGFARGWEAAIEQAGNALLDQAFDRVVHGDQVEVFDKEGRHIASRTRRSDRLTIFLLRGFFPERFGHIDDSSRRAARSPAPVEPEPIAIAPDAPPAASPAIPVSPMPAALAALDPVCPANPHLRMAPEDLREFIETEAFDAAEDERFAREHPELAERWAQDEQGIERLPDLPLPEPDDEAEAEPEDPWGPEARERYRLQDEANARRSKRARRRNRASGSS